MAITTCLHSQHHPSPNQIFTRLLFVFCARDSITIRYHEKPITFTCVFIFLIEIKSVSTKIQIRWIDRMWVYVRLSFVTTSVPVECRIYTSAGYVRHTRLYLGFELYNSERARSVEDISATVCGCGSLPVHPPHVCGREARCVAHSNAGHRILASTENHILIRVSFGVFVCVCGCLHRMGLLCVMACGPWLNTLYSLTHTHTRSHRMHIVAARW